VRVDRRVLLDERVHVGDRDPQPRARAVEPLGDRELVEVAGVVVVDRAPGERAQVADAGAGGVGRAADAVELGERVAREVGLEALLAHRAAGDRLQVVAVVA
jgi:hypothetical protein